MFIYEGGHCQSILTLNMMFFMMYSSWVDDLGFQVNVKVWDNIVPTCQFNLK